MCWWLTAVVSFVNAQRTSQTAELLFADPTEIATTATRTQRQVNQSPVTVRVLPQRSLELGGWMAVQEALERQLPDILPFEGSLMRFLSVRGSFSSSEFNERVLVLLDGVPLNDPVLGHVPLMAFPMMPLERIEVVYGPGSALYGANAFAGVVEMKSASPSDGHRWRAWLGGGDGTRRNLALWGAHASSRWKFSASVWAGADGGTVGIHNDADTRFGQMQIRWQASPTVQWTLRSYLFSMRRGVNGRTVAVAGTPNDFYENEQLIWSLERSVQNGVRTHHWLRLYGQSGTHLFDREQLAEPLHVRYRRLGAEVLWQHQAGQNCWTFGLEARQESASGSLLRPAPTTTLWSAYAQLEWTRAPLYLTLGMRHDNHSIYGHQRSVRGALVYSPTARWSLRASYGTAFRAPNFAELYTKGYWVWTPIELDFSPVYAMGDPNLRPEQITAWEIGLHHQISERLQLDLSYFDKDHANLISLELHEGHPSGITWQHAHYRNLMHYHVAGWSASLGWQLSQHLQFATSWFYVATRHWGSYSSHPTVRQIGLTRSRWVASLRGEFSPRLSWQLESVLPPYDTGTQQPLLALALGYQPDSHRGWQLRLDNLLNARYSLSPLLRTHGIRLSLSYQQSW